MASDEEEGPLLGRMNVEASSSRLQMKDYCAGLAALVMVGLGIAAVVVVCVYQTTIMDEYSIVLDAGSTHTDMMVYKWSRGSVIHNTGLVEEIGKCTSPGGSISSYATKDPNKAGSSLLPCINNMAKQRIPSYLQHKSPIYLGATAGMRLVEEVDSSVAMALMKSVRQTLHNSPFQFSDDMARVISGEEEGLSSWVTVNYLEGKLLYREITSNSTESSAHLIGALDMGGASTQITFIPDKHTIMPSKDIQHLRLYGRDYNLYTHSYLCYGKKEAERRFMASLLFDQKSLEPNKSIDNPCGPKGLSVKISTTYLTQPPCVNLPSSGWHINSSLVTFSGTSNISQCVDKVQKLFNFSQCHLEKNCSFDGVYLPSTEGAYFLAFSSYFYTISDLNLTTSAQQNITLGQFKEAADRFCNRSWSEIIHGKSKSVVSVLKNTCLDAQYVYTILSQGYHIPDDSKQVKFKNTIQNRSLGWALGFMINATNLIPSENLEYRVKPEAFLAVVIVGSILISLGLLLIVMATRRVIDRQRLSSSGLII